MGYTKFLTTSRNLLALIKKRLLRVRSFNDAFAGIEMRLRIFFEKNVSCNEFGPPKYGRNDYCENKYFYDKLDFAF